MSQLSAALHARFTRLALAALVTSAGQAQAQNGSVAVAEEKIPITTSVAQARQEYVKGRTLGENLRANDSRQFFERAAAKDPSFALAHYSLALNSPTAKEFFGQLKQAVTLAPKASDGERLMILGLEAGANGDTRKQLDYYERLVAAYPNDERAHFLLGTSYFGQQNYPKTIREYQRSIEIAPDYAPAYNLLGYAQRQVGQFGEAEKAFKKYIVLIPNDPNPYDSYAELLMKMGRFDESIAMYRKALAQAHFPASYVGIASNLMFQGKHDASRAEAWKLYQAAKNDGERRAALFASAVAYADEGKLDQALADLKKEYAVAEKINDAVAMSGDAVAMGDVLLEAGKPEDARSYYEKSLALQEHSDLSKEAKDDARLVHHYNLGRVALAANELAAARQHAGAFTRGATAKDNAAETRQAHELAGNIALQEKKFDQALAELTQANQQDPYVLYRMGLAYQGKGDGTKAGEMFKQAADHYTLPTLNYAFVRVKAKRMKA